MLLCLKRLAQTSTRNAVSCRWLSYFGKPSVEDKYVLPDAPSRTAAIIKTLYEQDSKVFTHTNLWDTLQVSILCDIHCQRRCLRQEYEVYMTKASMKKDLKRLKALGYVTYLPPPKGHIDTTES